MMQNYHKNKVDYSSRRQNEYNVENICILENLEAKFD